MQGRDEGEAGEDGADKAVSPEQALRTLLQTLFGGPRELEILISEQYPEIGETIEWGQSLMNAAFDVVARLSQHGKIDGNLFDILRRSRAQRGLEIERVQRRWGTCRGSKDTTPQASERLGALLGRQDELAALDRLFVPTGSSRVVLHGMPGVGKSRLAAEFAERMRAKYRHVWTIDASTDVALLDGLAGIAAALQLPRSNLPRSRDAVRWFCENDGWLLVLDDSEGVPPLFQSWRGNVLITTLDPEWGVEARLDVVRLCVDPLALRDAVALLRGWLTRTSGPLLERLAVALGRCPIVLEQAAIAIRRSDDGDDDGVGAYLDEVVRDAAEGLPATSIAYRVFSRSIQRAEEQHEHVRVLAGLLAYLDPAGVAVSLLRRYGSVLTDREKVVFVHNRSYLPAMAALRRYAIVQTSERGGTRLVVMHRMMQAVVRDRLLAERDAVADAALELATAAFQFVPGTIPLHTLPPTAAAQAITIVTNSEIVGRARDQVLPLLLLVCDFCRIQGALAQALVLADRAVDVSMGELAALRCRARVHYAAGDNAAACADLERALAAAGDSADAGLRNELTIALVDARRARDPLAAHSEYQSAYERLPVSEDSTKERLTRAKVMLRAAGKVEPRVAEAVVLFESAHDALRSLESLQQLAGAWFKLGEVREGEARMAAFEQGLARYEELQQLDRENIQATLGRADCHRMLAESALGTRGARDVDEHLNAARALSEECLRRDRTNLRSIQVAAAVELAFGAACLRRADGEGARTYLTTAAAYYELLPASKSRHEREELRALLARLPPR